MVLGRMRMKKTPDGKAYASVSVRLTDPGTARLVTDRYDEYLIYGNQGKPVMMASVDAADPAIMTPDEEEHPLLDLHPEMTSEE